MIKSRRVRWKWHVARTGENRSVCRLLARKPEGKRPPGRSRLEWVFNIEMALTGLIWPRMWTSRGLLW
jgi:hypothetical protein